jgi:hypothetical protein
LLRVPKSVDMSTYYPRERERDRKRERTVHVPMEEDMQVKAERA